LCDPIIKNAGKDITFWFDPNTKEPRRKINLQTGEEEYYTPNG